MIHYDHIVTCVFCCSIYVTLTNQHALLAHARSVAESLEGKSKLAYIVVAYIVMAHIVMAYIVMAH